MKQILILTLLIITMNSFCQTGEIKGMVRNGVDGIPSQFVTIGLHQNDKIVLGTISDSTGQFQFENINQGAYELKFSFVGYHTYTIPKFQIFRDSTIYFEIKYPCPNGTKKSKKICPHGHSDSIIPIVYGLPTKKTMKKAEKGKVELGGCIITECSPCWHCKKHGISF